MVLNIRPYRFDTEIFIELEKFITRLPLYKLLKCQSGLMEDPSDFILFGKSHPEYYSNGGGGYINPYAVNPCFNKFHCPYPKDNNFQIY